MSNDHFAMNRKTVINYEKRVKHEFRQNEEIISLVSAN